ncbi:MAG: hypothetical protein R3D68_12910 [Hyphomicrobiaceae bacterium]
MKESTSVVTIPMFVLEFGQEETTARNLDDMVAHLRGEIERHSCARFIGIFDHYAHTRALPDGEIAPEIEDARNVVFCFGIAIPEPCALATRPRSIGLCKLADSFVISFLEHPMPLVNSAMEGWVRGLVNKNCASSAMA